MRQSILGSLKIFIMCWFLLSVSSPVHALTFNYTGNMFTDIEDSNLGERIIASVTFDDSVANYTGRLSLREDSSKFLDWTISAGDTTFSKSDANWNIDKGIDTFFGNFAYINFLFELGTIVEWTMNADYIEGYIEDYPEGSYPHLLYERSLYTEHRSDIWIPLGFNTIDTSFAIHNNFDNQDLSYFKINKVRDQKGSWTLAPVPEPATLILFGTGLAGLAAVGRRRKS